MPQGHPVPRGHKGEPRTPGSGRLKGEPNKLTKSVKEVIASVFNELQEMNEKGAPRYPGAYMLNWAKNEPGEFYRLAARLIPTELQGTAPLTIQLIKFADLPDRDDIE